MSSKHSSSTGGIGLAGIVFAVFLALKLAGVPPVSGWSWWWVTSPMWLGGAALVAFVVLYVLGLAAGSLFGGSSELDELPDLPEVPGPEDGGE